MPTHPRGGFPSPKTQAVGLSRYARHEGLQRIAAAVLLFLFSHEMREEDNVTG